MAIVKDRYRGTPIYHLVFQELVRAAQYRGVTTYQDIAQLMGLPLRGSNMGREVGIVLGEISEDEVAAGRPMLSAVAVNVKYEPGEGFYGLARQLDLVAGDDKEKLRAFWVDQCDKAYDTWKRPLRPEPRD